MSYAQFMKDFFDAFARQIQLGFTGKIDNFYKDTMRADVTPLLISVANDDSTKDYPSLSKIPVNFVWAGGYYIRPDYQAGDLVWITFSTFDIFSALSGTKSKESDDIFGLQNACVSGGIAKTGFTAPNSFAAEDGLLIGEKSGNAFIVFGKDSIKMKFADGAITTTFDATGIVTDMDVKSLKGAHSLNTHAHQVLGPIMSSAPVG